MKDHPRMWIFQTFHAVHNPPAENDHLYDQELFAGLGGFRLGLEAIGGWEFGVSPKHFRC